MGLGEKIKSAMREKNLTQQKLAEKLGVKQNTISQWVTEINEPSCEMIVRLCKELEITPNELFGWESIF